MIFYHCYYKIFTLLLFYLFTFKFYEKIIYHYDYVHCRVAVVKSGQ